MSLLFFAFWKLLYLCIARSKHGNMNAVALVAVKTVAALKMVADLYDMWYMTWDMICDTKYNNMQYNNYDNIWYMTYVWYEISLYMVYR